MRKGLEKRGGPNQSQLSNIKLPTPWNHIEAALGYSRGYPLLVIAEVGLKNEGLISNGYDWYVQWVNPTSEALNTFEFNGVLSSWKQKIKVRRDIVSQVTKNAPIILPSDLTIAQLVGALRPSHLWSALGAIVAVVVGAFTLGTKLLG